MLAARRDPVFDRDPAMDSGSADPSLPPRPAAGPTPPAATPAFTRFIAGVQILGTVLAIPLGLASGYSIYRANFSPEAKCGSSARQHHLHAGQERRRYHLAPAGAPGRRYLRALLCRGRSRRGRRLQDAAGQARGGCRAPKGDKTVRAVKEAKAIKPAKVDKKLEKKVEKRAEKKVAHAGHRRACRACQGRCRLARRRAPRARRAWAGDARGGRGSAGTVGAADDAANGQTDGHGAAGACRRAGRAAFAAGDRGCQRARAEEPDDTPAPGNDESHPVPPALIPDVGSQPETERDKLRLVPAFGSQREMVSRSASTCQRPGLPGAAVAASSLARNVRRGMSRKPSVRSSGPISLPSLKR